MERALQDDLYPIFEKANHKIMSSSEVIPELEALYREKYQGKCEPGSFMEQVAFLASDYQDDHSRLVECFEEVTDYAEAGELGGDDAVNVEGESEND